MMHPSSHNNGHRVIKGAALLRQSDIQAERIIAILRMILSFALFAGVSTLIFNLKPQELDVRRVELLFLLGGAAAYFTLGAVNFFFSHPSRFQFWHSWLFNALEVALLGFQIYIDVRNPLTPSLLALASPLLLVVALVLAIQSLRYRLELHIFTAVILLMTCAALTFYDPQHNQPWDASVIQELQVLYSAPPNVMRFVVLGTLALVVGSAVYRARRLVFRVAREVEDADNLRRFLPAELGSNLSDDALRDLRTPDRKDVVILMIDLRGFTELTDRLPAPDIAEMLTWFRSLVTDAAEQHAGIVDKFVGDGAMVIFGLHDAPDTAVRNALAGFDDICAALEHKSKATHADQVRVAAGLHCGAALVGAFGDNRRLEFTALGKTVNVASRLEAIAKDRDLALVLSGACISTGELDPAAFEILGDVQVRGIAEPIQIACQRGSTN